MVETAKDRWNGEVEGLVRRVQGVDWRSAREGLEDRLTSAWRKVREEREKS